MGRAITLLLDGLRQNGISADFICSSDLKADSIQRITTLSRKLAKFFPETFFPVLQLMVTAWETGRMAAKTAIEHGYTHLHCHDSVVAAGAQTLLDGHSIAWGISQHGYNCISYALHQYIHPLSLWFRLLLWHWERRILAKARWIICPTSSGRANLALESKLPINARWHAIAHPLPVMSFPKKDEARRNLGWSDGWQYILAVGQLIPLKRFELIIDAMADLPDRCRLVILGDGDQTPYRQRAERLGILPPIMTSTDTVGPYLAAADIFVSASATESFGMAILEAMMAGLPIVCTRVGGVADVVGDAAELAKPDGSDLASRLKHLIENPAYCAELILKSSYRIKHWPDHHSVAKRYLQVYEDCQKTGHEV